MKSDRLDHLPSAEKRIEAENSLKDFAQGDVRIVERLLSFLHRLLVRVGNTDAIEFSEKASESIRTQQEIRDHWVDGVHCRSQERIRRFHNSVEKLDPDTLLCATARWREEHRKDSPEEISIGEEIQIIPEKTIAERATQKGSKSWR